jgi:4-alpha-glucanotransferase
MMSLIFKKPLASENSRGAGVLMHITSLPSPFGIGDFGFAARAFADLLSLSLQKYWQLLPLSPVNDCDQYSPYSSWAAMGGNTLLISPELLVEDGLLTNTELDLYLQPSVATADFKTSTSIKNTLFNIAWLNYCNGAGKELQAPFAEFCSAEAYWLDDFATFAALKKLHNGAPWHQWEKNYKLRDKNVIDQFIETQAALIAKTKWLQFIFTRQWHGLKRYCNSLNIRLIGDLPFYVSYDSVDVWTNPEIFSLDNDGKLLKVGGVPPDYFNKNGQNWSMPVFKWDELKIRNYDWWVHRIRKNTELFDLLRLDHFRAFSSYWAVPATEATAINGIWEQGPGIELFHALKSNFGKLPFIAEDLGDVDEDTGKLLDELLFPGMKVLQFAFGGDLSLSPHILHNHPPNCIVYTGTHDNNTTIGWFKYELDKQALRNLNVYTGIKVKEKNVAQAMIKMALSSVAKIAIIPMQDLLYLDEVSRMNTPATTSGNWLWRITPQEIKQFNSRRLRTWIKKYNRE